MFVEVEALKVVNCSYFQRSVLGPTGLLEGVHRGERGIKSIKVD